MKYKLWHFLSILIVCSFVWEVFFCVLRTNNVTESNWCSQPTECYLLNCYIVHPSNNVCLQCIRQCKCKMYLKWSNFRFIFWTLELFGISPEWTLWRSKRPWFNSFTVTTFMRFSINLFFFINKSKTYFDLQLYHNSEEIF